MLSTQAEKLPMRWRRAMGCLLVFLLLWSCQRTPSETSKHEEPPVVDPGLESPLSTTPSRGVVVEEVGKGSALEKAGLQPGDVVLAWKRLPNPPANPDGAEGQLASVFDWLWLVVEQAPRGSLQLVAARDGEPQILTVELGLWDAMVRPGIPPTLVKPYLAGKELIEAGDHESGIALWQSIADTAHEQKDQDLQCWLQLRIGEVWSEERARDKAHAAYRWALEVAREPAAQVAVWDAVGKSYERQNSFSEAEASYRSAFEIRRATWGDHLGVAVSMNNLGNSAFKYGNLERATKHFQQAFEIHENLAPGSLDLATTLGNLGYVALHRGDLEQAADYLQRALETQENLAPESLNLARTLNNLGCVNLDLSNLERATEYLQRALEIRKNLTPGSLYVANGLNNLGNVAMYRGDLEQAADYLQQALEIKKNLAPGSLDVAGSLNNLGNLAVKRGDLERAADYLRRALEIQENMAPGNLSLAAILANLGNVSLYRGDLERAVEYFLQSLEIHENQAPGNLDSALILANLGEVALYRGDLEQAAEYSQRALEIQENIAPRSLDLALTLNNLGNVASDRGDLKRAAEYHQRALEIRENLTPGSLDLAESLNSLGLISRDFGDLKRAVQFFQGSITALEAQLGKLGGSHDLRGRFSANHGTIYRNALEFHLDLDEPAEAFSILERSRAKAFLAMLTERDLDFSADISEKLDQARRRFAVLFDQTLQQMVGLSPAHDQDRIASLKKKLEELRWEHEENMQAIRHESPKLVALQYPRSLNHEGARKALDPGTVLLSYSVGEERSDLFVLTRDGDLETHPIPMGLDDLGRNITRLRKLLEDPNRPVENQQTLLSHKLYQTLIAPARKTIKAGERILIAADGPLHILPFGALLRRLDNGGQQYLAVWKPLHSVLSATVYAELKKSRPAFASEADYSLHLAAFGDPIYDRGTPQAGEQFADVRLRSITEQDYFDWDPLPATRHEVEEIDRLFPAQAAQSYLGADATEDRTKTLGKTRIVHYAVHAFANERSPLDSGLVFTLPEQLSEDRDNGLLQAWEIFEQLRIDADLVVLSACDTGLGKLRGGEGLIGLTRAFQYAGARSVLATLWSIGDESTAELMIRFYRHLQAGKSKDEALRAAQLEFIRGPIQIRDQEGTLVERDYSDPYHWAAFQLIGDWQ